MSAINGLNGTDLSQLGVAGTPGAKPKGELGQEDFLKLMVAQLSNQDPMAPQENGEFLSQIAQFGTVDGIKGLQKSFGTLSASLQSNQALQASSLVGRSVQVPSDQGLFVSGQSISGTIELPASSTDLSVAVYNQQGELVQRMELGTHAEGSVPFSWNGIKEDGSTAAAGIYTVKAEAMIDSQTRQVGTYVSANVDSVTISQSDGLILNLAGAGSVPFSSVRQIQ